MTPSSPAVTAEVEPLRKTRVLVVDDSALIRAMLVRAIDAQPDMTAVGSAPDPLIAREMIRALEPDVLTLDVEMPHMDGIDFLERLMRLRPMPVVMVSTLTERGAEVALHALALGAIDCVAKPHFAGGRGIKATCVEIVDKIRLAARVDMRATAVLARTSRGADEIDGGLPCDPDTVVVVGSSTGGTEALRRFLVPLHPNAPPILVTQHMPPGFTRTFAARLDKLCRLGVSEAVHGARVLPGHAYLAPGDRHLRVRREGRDLVVTLSDDAPINRHRPSVEALFLSAAESIGAHAIGVMLTGMGNDGARAMLAMRDAGAWNIAQDEATCVVFGMPREAIATGAVHDIQPIDRIAHAVMRRATRRKTA